MAFPLDRFLSNIRPAELNIKRFSKPLLKANSKDYKLFLSFPCFHFHNSLLLIKFACREVDNVWTGIMLSSSRLFFNEKLHFLCSVYPWWTALDFWGFLTISFVRSSHPEVFCKKGVLGNFAKFTGKHLY